VGGAGWALDTDGGTGCGCGDSRGGPGRPGPTHGRGGEGHVPHETAGRQRGGAGRRTGRGRAGGRVAGRGSGSDEGCEAGPESHPEGGGSETPAGEADGEQSGPTRPRGPSGALGAGENRSPEERASQR